MPEMDGFEATKEIRETLKKTDLPIIAMTANALTEDRTRCLEAGMVDHIPKPIDPDCLYVTLANTLAEFTPATTQHESPTAASEPKGLPDQLPGINLEFALKSVVGNETLLLKLLKEFGKDHCNDSSTLQEAMDNQQFDEGKRIAHTVKGLAATLGANDLSSSAKQLETLFGQEDNSSRQEDNSSRQEDNSSRQNDNSNWNESLDAFTKSLAFVMDGLAGLDQQSSNECVSDTIDTKDVLALIDDLTNLFEDMDPDSADKAETLVCMLQNSSFLDDAKKVQQQTDDFEFDDAKDTLQKLRNNLENDDTA